MRNYKILLFLILKLIHYKTNLLPVKSHGPIAEMKSPPQILFGNIQSFEVKITCQSDMFIESCTFLKNGENLMKISPENNHLSERYHIHSDGYQCELIISNVSQQDVGNYSCLIMNEYGGSVSSPSTLIYAPLYNQDTKTQIFEAKPNETLIIPCDGLSTNYNKKATNFLVHRWVMENTIFADEEIPKDESSNKYHILDDGSLVIFNTKKSDNGKVLVCTQSITYQDYKLDVKSGKKKVKISANGVDGTTDYYVSPKADAINQVVTGIEGKSFDLKAVLASQSPVMWKFNGEDISLNSNGKSRKHGRVLHFAVVERTDAGVYTAFTDDEQNKAITFIFKVESLPKFKNELNNHVIEYNGSLNFDCSTISSQIPVRYNWFINGKEISKFNKNEVELKESQLAIHAIWNSMIVQCEAINEYGSAYASSVVVVAAKTVSLISESYSNSFEAGYNLYIVLRCPIEYDQNLVPSITWYFNNEEIPIGGKYKMDSDSGSLMFKTSQSDGGNYTCIVQTPFDSALATTKLLINPDFSGPFTGPWWFVILLIVLCFIMVLIIICLVCFYIRGRRIYDIAKSEYRAGRNSKLFESMRSARSYTLNTRENSHIGTEGYHYRVPY